MINESKKVLEPLLVLDSSIRGISLGLLTRGEQGHELKWHDCSVDNAGSVIAISHLLNNGLAALGLEISALRGLLVSSGPGSFTGIKIGLAFAYGLKAGLGPELACSATSALEAAARELAREAGAEAPVALLLPATRTHGFFCVDPGNKPSLASFRKPAALMALESEETTASFLAMPPDSAFYVVGSWPQASTFIRNIGLSATELAPKEVCTRAIYGMSGEAKATWPRSFGQTLPAPRFLRLSTAEERRAL